MYLCRVDTKYKCCTIHIDVCLSAATLAGQFPPVTYNWHFNVSPVKEANHFSVFGV